MASRLRVISLIIVVFGIISIVLFNFLLPIIGFSVYPFYGTTKAVSQNVIINPFSVRDDISLVTIPGFLSNLNVKTSFGLNSPTGNINCILTLIYEQSGSTPLEMDWTSRGISYSGFDDYRQVISTPIGFRAAGSGFTLYLKIENFGSNIINLVEYRVDVIWNVTSFYVPLIITFLGIILIIFSIIRGRRAPAQQKLPKVETGWEPTLQWGSGAGKSSKPISDKKSRFSIKSSKPPPKPSKTVVRKAAPTGGAQVACKFCGKQVPTSAFFCPHCYGKLR